MCHILIKKFDITFDIKFFDKNISYDKFYKSYIEFCDKYDFPNQFYDIKISKLQSL